MAEQYLRLMLAHAGSGVWDIDGTGDTTELLPLPHALKTRIEAWADAYDRWDREHNADRGSPPVYRPDFPFAGFDDEGEAIAALLRQELPGWTIFHQPCWQPLRF